MLQYFCTSIVKLCRVTLCLDWHLENFDRYDACLNDSTLSFVRNYVEIVLLIEYVYLLLICLSLRTVTQLLLCMSWRGMSDEVTVLASLFIKFLPRSAEITPRYVWTFWVLLVCFGELYLILWLLTYTKSFSICDALITCNEVIRHWEISCLTVDSIHSRVPPWDLLPSFFINKGTKLWRAWHLYFCLLNRLVCILCFSFSLSSCHSSDMIHTFLGAHTDSVIIKDLALTSWSKIWKRLVLLRLHRWLLDYLLIFTRIFSKNTDSFGLYIWTALLICWLFIIVGNKVCIWSCLLLFW